MPTGTPTGSMNGLPYTPPVIVLVYHSQQRKTGFDGEWLAHHSETESIELLPHHASECIGCHACESRCPFGAKIADRMQKTAALFGC